MPSRWNAGGLRMSVTITWGAAAGGAGWRRDAGRLRGDGPWPRCGRWFYLRFAPGADPQAAAGSLRRLPSGAVQVVDLPRPPPDVANLGRVGGLPNVLAGLLGLLAARPRPAVVLRSE